MAKEKRLEPISIRLEPEVKAALDQQARADDRSLSNLINRILREYVELQRTKKPVAKPGRS